MPFPFAAVGLGIQGLTSAFALAKGIQSLNEAKKIKPLYQKYETSPYAKQMLGRSQQLLNARNIGSEMQRRNILSSQANVGANITRGAIDPTMAMQGLLASQAMGDQAMNQQFIQEGQMQGQKEANLMASQQAMISEGDKVYADMMNKYKMDTDMKTALRQAGTQGIVNAGTSLAGTFMQAGGMKSQNDLSKAQTAYYNKRAGIVT